MVVISVLGVLAINVVIVTTGCKKVDNPTSAAALNQPTPPPAAITGPLEVYVTDNYLAYPTPASTPSINSLPVTGLTVQAIPPSNSVTYTKTTQPDGKAYFTPPTLELGNWTIIVPKQTGYPFAKSVITAPVTVAYETIPVFSLPATLYNSTASPQVLTGTQGSTIVANYTYNQPGNLLVPISFAFPTMPTNWTVHSGSASIGFASSDNANVTFIGANCVDHAVTYNVSGYDFQPTPVFRVVSAPASITKSFTSSASSSWQTNSINNNFCSDGNLILEFNGTLNFSSTNACGNITVSWKSGNCCSQGMQVNGGTTYSSSDCSGGSFNLGPGSYSIFLYNDQYVPVIYVTFQGNTYNITPSFSNGAASQQFFSVSY